jgi:hypothetical protein
MEVLFRWGLKGRLKKLMVWKDFITGLENQNQASIQIDPCLKGVKQTRPQEIYLEGEIRGPTWASMCCKALPPSATVPPQGVPTPRLLRMVAACASPKRRVNGGSFRGPDSAEKSGGSARDVVAGMAGQVGGEAAAQLDREGEEIHVRFFPGVTYAEGNNFYST